MKSSTSEYIKGDRYLITITETKWRPFIELTADGKEPTTFYFDVTKRPLMFSEPERTVMQFEEGAVVVKESMKEILEAVDKLIEIEQDKKAEQAKKYMEATKASVENTKKLLEEGK